MDNGLRIVQGNTFATAIEIHAVDATGQPIVDWSLQDSTDIRVWYVFAGREQDITTWQIDDGKLVIVWLANMQRVGTYDIFCAGKYNGADWRNAMQYQFSIVRFNHEANIPANVVILDGIYQLSAEMALLSKIIVEGIPSETIPLMDGEADVGTEERYARGDHRHPSDTSKQDVIADLATIRSGAAAGATAYQKPSTGIPKTDLASGVIPDVSQFITKSVNDLVNYYTKSQTYTQSEVNSLIAGISGFEYEVVATLPTASASTMHKIYFVPSSNPQTQNVKDEYITIQSGSTYSWELIGSTAIDLSGYVTTEELNEALADYVSNADLTEALSDYAKIDGAYEGMLAGNAMNLVDTTGTPILREFVFSKSGGSEQIATGTALIKSLRGNTIVWNQLQKNVLFENNAQGYMRATPSETFTIDNGIATITADNNGTAGLYYGEGYQQIANHKYYLSVWAKAEENVDIFYGSGTNTFHLTSAWQHCYWFRTANNDSVVYNNCYVYQKSEFAGKKLYLKYYQLIDLTQMFGSGHEPTTVAEFESLFPLDYYEYNTGELLSFSGDSIKTVGFNQWDEDWEVGGINTTTGENNQLTDRIRSKNYIPILPNTPYCLNNSNNNMVVLHYDANKNYNGNYTYHSINNQHIYSFTDGTCYIKFYMVSIYGTTYNHDICINLSDPSKNGTYEPYVVNTKDISFYKSIKDGQGNLLFPDASMHSAGSAYDEATENKARKVILDVDMGIDMSWGKFTLETYTGFYSGSLSRLIKAGVAGKKSNILCARYIVTKTWTIASTSDGLATLDKSMMVYTNGNLYLRDDSFANNTAAEFRESLQGVHLYVELAEPIEVDIEEQNLTYPVDGGGTEQLLPENTSTPTTTPARLDVNYGLDAMATLKNLQKNYLAQTDLDRLLTAEGYTYTKTWDATNNQWNFTISGNSNIVDSLSSASTTAALSANQGKVLNEGKQDKIDNSHKLSADLVEDANTTNKFVTESEKTSWNAKQVNVIESISINGTTQPITDKNVDLPVPVSVDVDTIVKVTQAAFDALATKDSSTLYLITS